MNANLKPHQPILLLSPLTAHPKPSKLLTRKTTYHTTINNRGVIMPATRQHSIIPRTMPTIKKSTTASISRKKSNTKHTITLKRDGHMITNNMIRDTPELEPSSAMPHSYNHDVNFLISRYFNTHNPKNTETNPSQNTQNINATRSDLNTQRTSTKYRNSMNDLTIQHYELRNNNFPARRKPTRPP